MDQQQSVSPVDRAVRWRYQSAVQAARMLNALTRAEEPPRPTPVAECADAPLAAR